MPEPAAACPRCGRSVATRGPRCLYCGATLPASSGPPTTAAEAPAGPPRGLLILDLAGAAAAPLASALGLRLFEADQLVRRGGFHLLRAGGDEEIGAEAARLREADLAVSVVPEAEARPAPLVATRGKLQAGELTVRHAAGELRLVGKDLLLVVQGPIAREYQPSLEVKRVRSASLEHGYRFQLHRLEESRPLELDPGAFEFGTAVGEASSLLTLAAWVRELGEGIPTDDHFRRLPPALGAASSETEGAVAAAGSLAGAGRRDKAAPQILDNLAQFRFYSGWRSALERRRRRG